MLCAYTRYISEGAKAAFVKWDQTPLTNIAWISLLHTLSPFILHFLPELISSWTRRNYCFACASKVKSYRKSTHSLSCLWKSSIFQQYAAACPSYWWEGGSCCIRAKMGVLFQEPFVLRSLARVTCQGAQRGAMLSNVHHNYSPGCQILCQLLCCVSSSPQEQGIGANIALS